ncbi:MAG: LVIVD repeat-containing protein [Candidatus Heimdallarchaeota archaeon]
MANNKRQIVITMVIISLFVFTFSPPKISGTNKPVTKPFRLNGTELFVENFSTTVFMDPATTTPTWGSNYLINTRNATYNFLDSYATTQPVWDIDVQGRKAFVTGHNFGSATDSLVALDINDPLAITLCSTRTSLNNMTAIAVDGDNAYTGTGMTFLDDGSINTYNVSDPYALNAGGVYRVTVHGDGEVTDIETNGHLVYYTAYNSTSGFSLRMIDAEDPDNPIQYTCDWANEEALGLEVHNNLAYVAAGTTGFYILDVSDKHVTQELGYLPLTGNASEVVVEDGIAYVAAGSFLHTINVRDPINPILLDSTIIPMGVGYDLVKQGDMVIVADGFLMEIFDVADPENILVVGPILGFNNARAIDLYGGIIVLGDDDGIYTFEVISDVGDGILDFSSSRAQYPNHFTDLQSWDVRVDGKTAYIAGGPDGFYTLDVNNPHEPEVLDRLEIPGQITKKLEKHGNFIYCTTQEGLYVFDVTDPSNIIETTFTARFGALDVTIWGDVAFVSLDGSALSGFAAYNISQPGNAVFMYNEVCGTNITSIDVQGPHLYVVDDVSPSFVPSFYIYQLLDINNPILTANVSRYARHYDICVDGDTAYLASLIWSTLYDVQDPFSPGFMWDIQDGSAFVNATGVWQWGPYTMTAGNDDGIFLVHNPMISSPTMTQYDGVDDALQITAEGDFTYAACKDEFVILRHYESGAATFWENTTEAISLPINIAFGDGELTSATLFADDFIQGASSIDYFMSADGGAHWAPVENGIPFEFIDRGTELLWAAQITSLIDASPRISEIAIEYNYNVRPTEPTLTALEDKFTGMFKATWTESTDDVAIDHYQVQLSDSIGFTNILVDKTTNKLSKSFTTGKTGTLYVRVRAVDGEGLASAWNLDQLNVSFSASILWGIIGGVVLIVVVVVTAVILVKKKKSMPER